MDSQINMVAVYIADTIAICLGLLILTSKSWTTALSKRENTYFRVLIAFLIVTSVIDVFSFRYDGLEADTPFKLFVAHFANYWAWFQNIIIGPLWIVIIITHITGKKVPTRQKVFISILCLIGLTLLIINPFIPIVFSIDTVNGIPNVYQRGDLSILFYVIEGAYVLDGTITYFVYRKRDPSLKHFPVFQFVIPFAIGVLIQVLYYGVSTMMVFLVISIVGMLFGLSNENEAEAAEIKERQKNLEIIAQQKILLEEQQVKLEEAVALAESANKAKTSFLNNMSHDIRTPMNAIVGYTSLASKNIDNKEQVVDYLGKIDKSSEHLLSLINDVLDMSRIESGKMHLTEQEDDINEIVNNLKDIVQADVNAKEQTITLENENVKHGKVMVDKLRLNQVLLNIISNSIKYTQKGGTILFKVTEELDPTNKIGKYTFVIKDNGMGMSEEFLKTIFEPFTRVNSTTVSGIQGTGLGMAITKKFIDMMNGTIDIKSKEGEGTETTITFTFATIDSIEKEEIVETNYDFTGRKVLLVDDNELNREIATEVLQEYGLVITSANDGTEAVDIMSKAQKDDFDVILMDVQMPIMNGYDATRAIRNLDNKDVASLPIIAMTANAFEEDKKEALDAGMDDYVTKPVDIEKLKKVLAKYFV